jgi:hypothetical protein
MSSRGRGRGATRYSTTSSNIGFAPPITLESVPLNQASAEIFAENQIGMLGRYGNIPDVEIAAERLEDEASRDTSAIEADDDDDVLPALDDPSFDVSALAERFLRGASKKRPRQDHDEPASEDVNEDGGAGGDDDASVASPPAKRVAVEPLASDDAPSDTVSDIHKCLICELDQVKADDAELMTFYNFVDDCAFRGAHPVNVANYAVSYFNLLRQSRQELRTRYSPMTWQRVVNHLNGSHAGKDIHVLNAKIHDLQLFLDALRNAVLKRSDGSETQVDNDTVKMYLVVLNTMMKMIALRGQIVAKRDDQMARAKAAEENALAMAGGISSSSNNSKNKRRTGSLQGFIRASFANVRR